MMSKIPHHWFVLSDSCSTSTAPISVHIGADDLIGPTIEIGKYFIA